MDATTEQPAAPDFALEPTVEPGHLPQRVIEELRHSYRVARDYSEAFGDCVKAQAEKHKIVPAALRKYIAALEDDKVPKVRKEAESLQTLIGSAEQ